MIMAGNLSIIIIAVWLLILYQETISFCVPLKGLRNIKQNAIKMAFVTHFEEIKVPTGKGISLVDITNDIKNIVSKQQVKEGTVTVLSKHSTVSITINEMEPRLVDDTRQFLMKLAPAAYPYLHNDLEFRKGPENWPGGDEAWRQFRSTEPVNAHSHLLAILLGTSETIPIHKGELQIGTYQNIIVIELDGTKKTRTIAVQITGSL